jgi:hypothetical protein
MPTKTKESKRLAAVIPRLIAVIEDLSPGVQHIALKSYQEFNEAPIEARAALKAWKEQHKRCSLAQWEAAQ